MSGGNSVTQARQHVGNRVARHSPSYQLALVTPGISPLSASCRKHRRHTPNLRRKPRARPQRQQRLRCRTSSMGIFLCSALAWAMAFDDLTCFAFLAVVAITFYFLLALLPERHSHGLEQRHAFGVGLRRSRDRDVHALGLLHFGVIDLREDQLVADAERVVAAP